MMPVKKKSTILDKNQKKPNSECKEDALLKIIYHTDEQIKNEIDEELIDTLRNNIAKIMEQHGLDRNDIAVNLPINAEEIEAALNQEECIIQRKILCEVCIYLINKMKISLTIE